MKRFEEMTKEEIDALTPEEYEAAYTDWCKRCEEAEDAKIEANYI